MIMSSFWSRFGLCFGAALGLALGGVSFSALAQGTPSPYEAAVPMLEQAGGNTTCVSCFLERYAPAEQPKAFAVSSDGAYGARWHRQLSMEQVKREALESCQQKPTYNPANPCVIFFENDQLVWSP